MITEPASGILKEIQPRIRARFPLLDRDAHGRRRIYLNSGAGSLMVDTAIEAAARANRTLNPMPGGGCAGETETALFQDEVRALVGDFVHAGNPREISFHFSTTAALFNLAFGLRRDIVPDANLIVTDLDHMANVSPWETVLGEGNGCEVRRAGVAADGTLDADHLLKLADRKTRLLAMTMASNGFGTIPPLAEIIAAVRKKSPDCLVAVDAVHHALHGSIDVRAIGCDFLAFSGYKVFGPMLGVLWGKEERLNKVRPYRVETNADALPGKFEQGMLNNASLASLQAALEYLLWIAAETAGPGRADESRPERFVRAMAAVEEYERGLSRRVLEGFRRFESRAFTCYGITDPGRCAERDPTFAFEVAGQPASQTKALLWDRYAIQIGDSNHYSAAVYRHLRKPAVCRASFAHYDTAETVDAFLSALAEIVASSAKGEKR